MKNLMNLQPPNQDVPPIEGLLLVDKPKGKTSFSLIGILRKTLGVKKIGHAGTLDPFATGVMILLIGRNYTRLSDQFLLKNKEYLAELYLGATTDTYDCEGTKLTESSIIPTLDAIESTLAKFQGDIEQIPPMFSAKKVQGKKLYELARKGQVIERKAVLVNVSIELISYEYPYLKIKVKCSKGTYIRSLAYDIGLKLGCGAYLTNLKRTKSGIHSLEECLDGTLLNDKKLVLEKLQKIN